MKTTLRLLLPMLLLLAMTSCGNHQANLPPLAPPGPAANRPPPAPAPASSAPGAAADLTRLPIADGRISAAPQSGSIWACATHFGGGGAHATGAWVRGDGTFDLTAKPEVDGEITWPHELAISHEGTLRIVTGNLLPNHPTGVYPISDSDDAYQYDRNPNAIAPKTLRMELPALPTAAEQASCVPMGPIGVLLTGSALFNALDGLGRDAVAYEIQDRCDGHPERQGLYHYHRLPRCIDDAGTGHSKLMGYAFDGFGIYGYRGEHGQVMHNSDLDACHGHTHAIAWDGQTIELYHYHATPEYPYTISCFHGEAVRLGIR